MRLGLWILTTTLSVGLACTSVLADSSKGLPTADPAALGFSPERLARLGSALDGDIKMGRIPGAVVLVTRHGKVGYFEAFGLQNKQGDTPMGFYFSHLLDDEANRQCRGHDAVGGRPVRY